MINMIQSAKDQVLELTERAYRAAAAAARVKLLAYSLMVQETEIRSKLGLGYNP